LFQFSIPKDPEQILVRVSSTSEDFSLGNFLDENLGTYRSAER